MKRDLKYWRKRRERMPEAKREALEQDFEPTFVWRCLRGALAPQALNHHLHDRGIVDLAFDREQQRFRQGSHKPLRDDVDPEDPHDHEAEIDANEAIGMLLTLLPSREQQVIRLLYLQRFTHLEAACFMGLSEKATYRLEERSVTRLRTLLQKISGMFGVKVPRRDPSERVEPARWRRTCRSRGFLSRT